MSKQRRFDRIMRVKVICSVQHTMSYRPREGYNHTPHQQPSYPANRCSNLAFHRHGEQRKRYMGKLDELVWTDEGRETLARVRKRHLSDGSRQPSEDRQARQGDETLSRE